MNGMLEYNEDMDVYEGYSEQRGKHLRVSQSAMAQARQIGVARAETNIHFFTRIMQVDFWLADGQLLALEGVSVDDTTSSQQ